MPSRLSGQILDHDSTQDHQFRFHAIQNAVVGEVQAVRDFDREPGKVLMRCQGVFGGLVVSFVDLVKPVAAAFAVGFAGLPVFASINAWSDEFYISKESSQLQPYRENE